MKFCKDCRHHFIPGKETIQFSKCKLAPLPLPPEYLVTGNGESEDFSYCLTFRSDYEKGSCGVDARYFESITIKESA